MDNISKKLLKLAVDPNATQQQILAGLDMLMQSIDADNARSAANPPPPMPTAEERLRDARRRANANLSKLRRR